MSCSCCLICHTCEKCQRHYLERGSQALQWLPPKLHKHFVYWLEKRPELIKRYETDYHSVLRQFFSEYCQP